MTCAFVLVLDSIGCGVAPDAAAFGDEGSNTLAHIAQACAAGRAEEEPVDIRRVASDKINPAVGLDWLAEIGRHVDSETPIARVHAAKAEDVATAKARLLDAYQVNTSPVEDFDLIKERI